MLARYSADLARWPSFWTQVTQFPTFFFFFFWFGFYGPFKNISLILSRSFIEGGRKPENPEKNHLTICKQNLAFPHMTRARLSFELDLELIKTNILSKIHDDCLKTRTSRVLTIFSFDLMWWPIFWTQVTLVIQFRTWPRFHRGKHSEQVSSRLGQNCGL